MPKWLKEYWFPSLVVLLAALAGTAGLLGRREDQDGWYWFWNVVAVVALTASALVSAARNARSQRTAKRVRREFQVTINDTLGPLVRELSRLIALPKRDRAAAYGSVVTLGLSVTTGLTEAQRVRATLYGIEVQDGVETLVARMSVGRGDAPRSTFARGTTAGDDVWKVIDSDIPAYCEDVTKTPPVGWDSTRQRDYKTFISVAVRKGEVPAGMLTVNAPTPGDLTTEDVQTMQVIASLLGAALAAGSPSDDGRTQR